RSPPPPARPQPRPGARHPAPRSPGDLRRAAPAPDERPTPQSPRAPSALPLIEPVFFTGSGASPPPHRPSAGRAPGEPTPPPPPAPPPSAESELRSGFPARPIGNVGLSRPTGRIAAFAEVMLRVQRPGWQLVAGPWASKVRGGPFTPAARPSSWPATCGSADAPGCDDATAAAGVTAWGGQPDPIRGPPAPRRRTSPDGAVND